MNNPIANIISLIAEVVLMANENWVWDELTDSIHDETFHYEVSNDEFEWKLTYWKNVIETALKIGGTNVTS